MCVRVCGAISRWDVGCENLTETRHQATVEESGKKSNNVGHQNSQGTRSATAHRVCIGLSVECVRFWRQSLWSKSCCQIFAAFSGGWLGRTLLDMTVICATVTPTPRVGPHKGSSITPSTMWVEEMGHSRKNARSTAGQEPIKTGSTANISYRPPFLLPTF